MTTADDDPARSQTDELPPPDESTLWLVSFGDDDDREMRSPEIAQALRKGEIGADTIVWREGLPEWVAINTVPMLARLLVTSGETRAAPAAVLGKIPLVQREDRSKSGPASAAETPVAVPNAKVPATSAVAAATPGPTAASTFAGVGRPPSPSTPDGVFDDKGGDAPAPTPAWKGRTRIGLPKMEGGPQATPETSPKAPFASATGTPLPSTKTAGPTGTPLPTAKTAGPTGTPLPTAKTTGPTGTPLPTTAKSAANPTTSDVTSRSAGGAKPVQTSTSKGTFTTLEPKRPEPRTIDPKLGSKPQASTPKPGGAAAPRLNVPKAAPVPSAKPAEPATAEAPKAAPAPAIPASSPKAAEPVSSPLASPAPSAAVTERSMELTTEPLPVVAAREPERAPEDKVARSPEPPATAASTTPVKAASPEPPKAAASPEPPKAAVLPEPRRPATPSDAARTMSRKPEAPKGPPPRHKEQTSIGPRAPSAKGDAPTRTGAAYIWDDEDAVNVDPESVRPPPPVHAIAEARASGAPGLKKKTAPKPPSPKRTRSIPADTDEPTIPIPFEKPAFETPVFEDLANLEESKPAAVATLSLPVVEEFAKTPRPELDTTPTIPRDARQQSASKPAEASVVSSPPAQEKRKSLFPFVLLGAAAAAVALTFALKKQHATEPVATPEPPRTAAPAEPTNAQVAAPSPVEPEAPATASAEAPAAPATAAPNPVAEAPQAKTNPVAPTTATPPVSPKPSNPTTTVATSAPAQPKPESTPKPAATPKPEASKPETSKPAPVQPEVSDVGGDFDRSAASTALGAAAGVASSCRKAGDPTGVAVVHVTFANSGRATRALVEGPPFAGTATGGCIADALRNTKVPPYGGDRVTVTKRVVIQ